MANVNAPYGFRLWQKTTGHSIPLAPGISPQGANPGGVPGGVVAFPSGAVLHVQDPIHVSLGLGYLAVGTNAIYGILNSPVPMPFGDTALQKHYPDILPGDDESIWRVQSIGTVNVTAALIGMSSRSFRIGGTTSGYSGINMVVATAGFGPLQVLALAPGSALGTYAELLIIVKRGAFFGAV